MPPLFTPHSSAAGKLSHALRRNMQALFLISSLAPLSLAAQSNGVLREVYTGIGGSSVSDLTSHPNFPNNPTFEEVITTGFEAPTDVMEEYGQRMTAYLIPPTTGNYVFWIASDDGSVLYLGTDEAPSSRQIIARVDGWTSSREWFRFSTQESSPIPLTSGKKYYLEALMKEGGGGDNLAVRWQLPNGSIEEPIPNNRLEVFGLGPPEIVRQPSPATVVEGGTATFTVELARSFGAAYQWLRNGQIVPGATGASYLLAGVSLAQNNTRYRCSITNSYGSVLSDEAILTVLADTTRPTLVAASTLGDSRTVTVHFSEPVEEATATNLSSYAINNGVVINSARFAGDLQTVVLKTTQLSAGVTYTLTVNNVRDRATTPNTILTNSQKTFSIDFTPLPISALLGTREPLGPSSRNTPLVITEIMYNPPARADGRETEFIEIYNSGPIPENISGFRISGDIDFTFPANTVIQAGGFLVVAPVPADVQAVYGIGNAIGGFTQRLSNAGGTIQLRNRGNAVLFEVSYANESPWPVAADNTGHSLVLARPSYGEADPRAWATSDLTGGTPGTAEAVGANPYGTILINEVLAHTDEPDVDYIELYNYGSQAVNIAGCWLSDRPDTNKFAIPLNTSIPARGFVVFDETQLGFSLSTLGEAVYLRNPAGNRVLDAVKFEAQENAVSIGHYPDGAPGWHQMSSLTPGEPNSPLWIRDVVINEIMFSPPSSDDDDEYVELYNKGAAPINLSGWRFVDGIDFLFPANTTIPPNGYLVVARNSTRLMSNYANLNNGNCIGNYQGTLDNGGERLALARLDYTVTTNNNVVVTNPIYIVVDEVHYEDAGKWNRWADGGGSSLELVDPRSDNRLMANWAHSDESTKSAWTLVEHTGVLDHGQGAINELQLMLLGAGECLVDNLEVRESSGGNLVANANFETGLSGWVIQGNHVNSGLSGQGAGYGGSGYALHLRASSGGDNGANRMETDLTAPMTDGNSATIRGRARWLRGHPDLLMRLHGNQLEAVGRLPIPRNLGTPGSVNSRYRPNIGPAIENVTHSPVLPTGGQAVSIFAQVNDPDALANLVVKYRIDPETNYSSLPMVYNGAGLYSASLPGQSAGSLVAFYIQALDGAASASTTLFPVQAPAQEALIRFGDAIPAGSFGVYRLWMTQKNIDTWTAREKLSNQALDGTFVYGNRRVIYNAGGRYRGSPWIRPGYNSPTGGRCAYVWTLPEDDLFLGADELNLDSLEPGDRDPTAMREVTSFWMAEQLGLAFSHQRYVHTVINGVSNADRGIPIYTDSQQPDSAYMRSWFADDDRGEIFKIDDWFEFNDSVGQEFNVDARLELYETMGGVKKKARYRWNWEKKFNRTLNDDYTSIFSLADAMNAPDASYLSQVENTIDVGDWVTVFALRHAVGDWDGYGYNRGKNQFVYKPTEGKWRMLLWDLDFSLGCYGGSGPESDLFSVNDPTIDRLYNHQHFRRAYFNALHRMAYGPFEATNVVPLLTARYNAFQANGISTVSPFDESGAQGISIPQWISQRRAYIIDQLASIPDTFAITSNNGSDFTSANNYITLTGTAPISVKTIQVNGISYPVVWTSLNTWTIRIALGGAVNNLTVRGLDYSGRVVSGAQDSINVTYTGTAQLPQDFLAINEIMYNPLTPGASFVEVFNRSTSNAFDLSNFRLNGTDFSFAEGTIVNPAGYLVVANDVASFIAAYGNHIPLAGAMNGSLDNGGETISLVKQGTTSDMDVIIDSVTYDDDAPWPALADGFGPSLQLIDPTQDNNRVGNWTAVSGGGGGGTETVIGITDIWKYNQAGAEPGMGWMNPDYSDSSWPSGAALLYVENSALPAPKNTLLTRGPITFYFRKSFTFNGNPATTGLQLNTIVDDGAVVYLNGVEVSRLGMPSGAVDYGTFSSRVVDNAVYEGPFTISSANLVQGLNVIAVEVHQTNPDSSDIVFGLSLEATSTAGMPYTPGSANSVIGTLALLPLVWLNEIQPNNVTGMQDNFGDQDPWLEIYNSSASAIDLSGFYLSDSYSILTKWTFPAGTSLNPGQYLLVWLDNEPGETVNGHLHANFRASSTNGTVVLSKVGGGATNIVDYLNYAPVNIDRSYGAYPNGTPAKRQIFYIPTPAAANDASYPATPVYINEWMAGNTTTVQDPADGDYDDWFELFNAGPTEVDLSGFYLTDDLTDDTKWTIPAGTKISAGEYLLIWADEEGSQNGLNNDLHANFKLGLGGEELGLFAPNGNAINTVTFGEQTNNVSQGRWPNGNTALYFMSAPTPGLSNTLGSASNTPPILNALGAKSGNEETLITFTASATDPDAGQSLTFSLDPGFPQGAAIHPESGVFTWTPTEGQGPGTYAIGVRVTDTGTPAQSDFESIAVTVNEENSAPTLAPIGDRTVNEEKLLTFTAIASDSDIPAQAQLFSLEPGAPAGAVIDANTGVFSWTTTEAQGPEEYSITIVASDNGLPALNVAETITITVLEVNRAPVLVDVSEQRVSVGTQVIVMNTATDPDLPANTLVYSLGPGAPSSSTIDATSGVFSWTPTATGTNSVTVIATDNGSPAMSDNISFDVVVSTEAVIRITGISILETGEVNLTWSSIPGETYRLWYKTRLSELSWTQGADYTAAGTSTSITLPASAASQTFYRIEELP